ncbi:inhibitor of trypsin and hageman factor isoform X2 [Eutrema salsugineum]|uniref:inhibitor of trypsin and hageman factor isoform X2 n=1 Tax=Eutrema salsugineum TaxID=72664 RepID=UPI000CED3A0D|nr:inhibitor of trypsin and hageman factor isoform X2 [Eutrema salsugineum]
MLREGMPISISSMVCVGLKVEWPELIGVSGIEAKKKIESDNPYVTAFIYPQDVIYVRAISCCNRVLLYVPNDNCPNGPVITRPIVG